MNESFPKPINKNKTEEKKEIKNQEGIDFVFSENPDIERIALEQNGNVEKAKEIYGNYIETIFPESELKDIVYHGSPSCDIQDFLLLGHENYQKQETTTTGVGGIYFADSYEYALKYTDFTNPDSESRVDENNRPKKGKVYPVRLDIKKPITIADNILDGINGTGLGKTSMWNMQEGLLSPLKKAGVDGMIAGEYMIKSEGFKEVVVFKSDQIHILGSKKDEEMFKQYLEKKKKK